VTTLTGTLGANLAVAGVTQAVEPDPANTGVVDRGVLGGLESAPACKDAQGCRVEVDASTQKERTLRTVSLPTGSETPPSV